MAPDAATELCFFSMPLFCDVSTYCNTDFSYYQLLNSGCWLLGHAQLLAFAVTEQISDS